eukprot:scaffold52414_cov33-Tisochrysis_lutea.AAC.2
MGGRWDETAPFPATRHPPRAPDHCRNSVGAGFAGFATHIDMDPTMGDLLAVPDPSTLTPLPWRPEVGWLSCNLVHNGAELDHGPRNVLRKVVDEVRRRQPAPTLLDAPRFRYPPAIDHSCQQSLQSYLCTLFSACGGGSLHEDGRRVRVLPPRRAQGVRQPERPAQAGRPFRYAGQAVLRRARADAAVRAFISARSAHRHLLIVPPLSTPLFLLAPFQAMGWGPYQADHEDASGQFEINWDYDDALVTADRVVFFKWARCTAPCC